MCVCVCVRIRMYMCVGKCFLLSFFLETYRGYAYGLCLNEFTFPPSREGLEQFTISYS